MTNHSLQSLGQTLRQARESRGLSLEQAEHETRIRAKFLLAIERGDLSNIPSRVQARGFVYNYAQYLGLNPAAIVGHFDAIHGTLPPPTARPAQPGPPVQPGPYPAAPQPPIPRVNTPPQPIPTPLPGVPAEDGASVPVEQSFAQRLFASDLFLVSVLALLAVLVLGVGGSLVGRLPASEAQAPPSAFLEDLSSEATDTLTPTFAPTSTPTATPPLLATDRVRVSLEVTQRNWMRIEVDGETAFEGLAEPGTILQYEGLDTVRVITGNGAALDVTYNGVALGPPGRQGEIIERIYTLGGLETPTPTPTSTATNTPIPTPTATPGASPTSSLAP